MKKQLLSGVAALSIMMAGGAAMADMSYGSVEKEMKETATEAKEMAKDAMASEKDVVATAAEAGQFSTLLAAAKAAGLVEALQAEGPITVFAPTDEAFAALPEGTVESLLLPENKEQLAGILKYHVVAGQIMAEDIAEGATAVETLQGTEAEVQKSAEGVTIDGANVVSADVKASNGVIHVIDKVILPN